MYRSATRVRLAGGSCPCRPDRNATFRTRLSGRVRVNNTRTDPVPSGEVCCSARHARQVRAGRPGCPRYGRPTAIRLARLPLQPAALTLGKAAPDTEPLIVLEGVPQALGAHLAAPADPLGLAGRAALLGVERLRVRLRAERALLPAQFLGLIRRKTEDASVRHGDGFTHGAPPTPSRSPPSYCASPWTHELH